MKRPLLLTCNYGGHEYETLSYLAQPTGHAARPVMLPHWPRAGNKRHCLWWRLACRASRTSRHTVSYSDEAEATSRRQSRQPLVLDRGANGWPAHSGSLEA
jgi:hypothetical protein